MFGVLLVVFSKCTVVKHLRELDSQALFDPPDLSVQGEGFYVQVSVVQDGASWGLVDTWGSTETHN